MCLGSPPRVWGQLRYPDDESRIARFTPTRVGTTRCKRSLRRRCTVHPHACGDNESTLANLEELGRFTPTRVGTTPTAVAHRTSMRVHPHACGDNIIIMRLQKQ